MLFLSLILAIIPIVIYLLLLWWLDKYDREPFKFLLLHFFWGMIGAIAFGILFSWIINQILFSNFDDMKTREMISSVVTAPIVEEAVKGFILIFTLTRRKFDNLTDGIVYGGSIGLGFGLTENFLYFFFTSESLSDLISLAIIRNTFSVSIHFVATATFGCFLALSKFNIFWKKLILIMTGYFIAVFIHAFWNFSTFFSWTFIMGLLFVIVSLILIYGLIQLSISFEKNIIFYELNEEILNGNLSSKYASVISDYRLRNNKGWISEHIRKDYINFATTLAFRKNQLKNIKSENLKKSYIVEIEFLRNKLHQLEKEANELLFSK